MPNLKFVEVVPQKFKRGMLCFVLHKPTRDSFEDKQGLFVRFIL